MNQGSKKGFTLIELMLAMTFIAFLLVAIAMVTIQISNIYNTGITLREVNQAGRSISTELQRSIATSTPFNVEQNAANSKYIVRDGGGRLCTGQYTYAWNYGDSIAGVNGAPGIYNRYQGDNTPVRFAKIIDSGGVLCSNPAANIQRQLSVEMLTNGDRDLVLHNFRISNGATDTATGQGMYAITMIIGTNDKQALLTNNTSCKAPSDLGSNQSYCSVNQFDVIVRAGNKTGSNN